MQSKDVLWRFKSELSIEYEIKKVSQLFAPDCRELLSIGGYRNTSRRLVLIDRNVDKLYGDTIRGYFENEKIEAHYVSIECSEENKNLDIVMLVLRKMEDLCLLRRSEPLVAIGGGVLLDIAGFAASLYRRGISYIRVPTTLISVVDASVGIKTGINCFQRRNRIGAYYPPSGCLIDLSFLDTLTTKQLRDGLSEIIKVAIVSDRKLFELLESGGQDILNKKFSKGGIANDIIKRSITKIASQLQYNSWEQDLCRLLDFGHIFSPIIEMHSLQTNTSLTHGEAVILDMYFSCFIASGRRLLDGKEFQRISTLIANLGLLKKHILFRDTSLILKAFNEAKNHRDGNQNVPLPTSIGSAQFYNDIQEAELERASLNM